MRIAAALFLLFGLIGVGATLVSMARPALAVQCTATGCSDRAQPIDLAPQAARPALSASPAARAAFERHLAQPGVRLGLAATQMIYGLPFAALMLTVGLALRKLAARQGDDLARALPWLRRASIAALAMAVATPLADSLQAMLLFPGTPSGPMWYLTVDFRRLVFDLLLACAAFSVVWALDAGSRAERDIAAFV